ncbi:MAG: phosphoribosyltransferase family protein, partial [Patescibacteria group bacterium]
YIDLRKLISKPKVRKEITRAFLKLLKNTKANVFVGIATGSIAYAAWLAEAQDKPMMYVRKQEKNHGTKMLVEGEVNKPKSFGVLVEDVVTTGESSLKSADILKNEGYKIRHCVCIFSYNPKEAGQKFLEKGVSLQYLTSLELVLDELLKSKAINGEQVEKIKKIFIT